MNRGQSPVIGGRSKGSRPSSSFPRNGRYVIETVMGKWQLAVLALGLFGSIRGHADTLELDLVSNNVVSVRGAILEWVDDASVTNGRFAPFLQIRGAGIAGDYNRSGKKNIQLHDIPMVSLNGTNFLQFALDVRGPTVSLDTIEIFTAPVATVKTNDLAAVGTKRWDLDKGCWDYADRSGPGCEPTWDDVVVQIDPQRNKKHSGVDMLLYVPVSYFADAQPNDYVYFFCVFGNPPKPYSSAITMHPKGPGTARWGIVKPLHADKIASVGDLMAQNGY